VLTRGDLPYYKSIFHELLPEEELKLIGKISDQMATLKTLKNYHIFLEFTTIIGMKAFIANLKIIRQLKA